MTNLHHIVRLEFFVAVRTHNYNRTTFSRTYINDVMKMLSRDKKKWKPNYHTDKSNSH